MKFIRTNLSIGMTILLALLTVVLAVIVVPFLLIVVACWLVRGISGGFFSSFSGRKDASSSIQERDHAPRGGNADERASSGDDAIECEVISARTIDENGQEIR